jgi:hypothetical protein
MKNVPMYQGIMKSVIIVANLLAIAQFALRPALKFQFDFRPAKP